MTALFFFGVDGVFGLAIERDPQTGQGRVIDHERRPQHLRSRSQVVHRPRLFELREEGGRSRSASRPTTRAWTTLRRDSGAHRGRRRIRRGRKINAERKFFPGYVLVKMDMSDEAYHLVKNTPKVTGFLGSGTKPMPVSDARWRGSSAPSRRASSGPSPPSLRDRRDGAGHRRPVRQLQRLGGAGRRGARAPARHRLDLRPRHAGGAGIRPGREAT